MDRFCTELSASAVDRDDGVALQVIPDPELNCIRIETEDVDYFGMMSMTIPRDLTPFLIEALTFVYDAPHWDEGCIDDN